MALVTILAIIDCFIDEGWSLMQRHLVAFWPTRFPAIFGGILLFIGASLHKQYRRTIGLLILMQVSLFFADGLFIGDIPSAADGLWNEIPVRYAVYIGIVDILNILALSMLIIYAIRLLHYLFEKNPTQE